MSSQQKFISQNSQIPIDKETRSCIEEFLEEIPTLEQKLSKPVLILYDQKTKVFYTECHLFSDTFVGHKDDDATIDPDAQEEYRLNRALQPTDPDFQSMKMDARLGRQFSDIVLEYNKEYKQDCPLKVLGGQHRSKAIELESPKTAVHGFRIYFNLTKDKRSEIARVSNTNIAIAEDLLDRLSEQSLEPPNKLRNFAHKIGLLETKKDFADRKSNLENLPTVRSARIFVVNFYKGNHYSGDIDKNAMESYLCDVGGLDPEYKKIFDEVGDFCSDAALVEAGKNFVKLNKKQHSIASTDKNLRSKKEFRNKALAPAMMSAWAFVSGLLQKHSVLLKKLYSLPDLSGKKDPLNAVSMSKFKFPPYDSETYRGLGTRMDEKERGRLVQLFLEFAKDPKKIRIDAELLELATRTYHGQKLLKR